MRPIWAEKLKERLVEYLAEKLQTMTHGNNLSSKIFV